MRSDVKYFSWLFCILSLHLLQERAFWKELTIKGVSPHAEGRKRAFLAAAFYDLNKLFAKRCVVVNQCTEFPQGMRFPDSWYLQGAVSGAGSILLVFFALTLAGIFFIMSACSANAPYNSAVSRGTDADDGL